MREIKLEYCEIKEADGVGITSYTIGYCSTMYAANHWVSKCPSYLDSSFTSKTLLICETPEDVDMFLNQQKRLKALSKLSKEDRAVLGLE
jgi:hypothetical protein